MPCKGNYYLIKHNPFQRSFLKKWDICNPKIRLALENFNRSIEILTKRFHQPLPGREAQLRMASMRRLKEGIPYHTPDHARKASVLILLYPLNDNPFLVFIRRIEYDGVHSGQISFPGGEREPADTTLADTALREAWEETGIEPGRVTLLGKLTELYIPPSNYLVTPIVGFTPERPSFRADPSEVQEILEIPLDRLRSSSSLRESKIRLGRDQTVTAPSYDVDGAVIWGATAMILSEFLELFNP
jgi:8-oxo-dGTP pyrophosphatase MutT (NUDIX family)